MQLAELSKAAFIDAMALVPPLVLGAVAWLWAPCRASIGRLGTGRVTAEQTARIVRRLRDLDDRPVGTGR